MMTGLLVVATAAAVLEASLLGRRWGGDVGLLMMAAFAILLVPAWAVWAVS